MTYAVRAYDAASRAMHEVERKIANLTRWHHPSPDSVDGRILASLIAKREREAPILIGLKAEANKAAPARNVARFGTDIKFKPREWQPTGTVTIEDVAGPIPACLQRVPA